MNPPKVADARRILELLGARAVLVVALGEVPGRDGVVIAGASYGETRAECRAAGRILDDVIRDATSGRWLTGVFQEKVPRCER